MPDKKKRKTARKKAVKRKPRQQGRGAAYDFIKKNKGKIAAGAITMGTIGLLNYLSTAPVTPVVDPYDELNMYLNSGSFVPIRQPPKLEHYKRK